MSRFVGTVFSTVDEAIDVLIRPAGESLIAFEKMKVLEYPDELGFNWRACMPLELGELTIPPNLVTPFATYSCELGDARIQLWRNGRKKLPPPTFDGQPPAYDDGERTSILAFDIKAEQKHAPDYCCDIEGPPALKKYCEDIIFIPLSTSDALGPAISTKDPYHFHASMLPYALTHYLYFSRLDDLESKVLKVLDHYSGVGIDDYSLLILQNSAVQSLMWTRPGLVKRAEEWLPSNPSSFTETKVKPTADDYGDQTLSYILDPFLLLPRDPFRSPGDAPTLLEARIWKPSPLARQEAYSALVKWGPMLNQLRFSITVQRRLAVSRLLQRVVSC